MFFGNEVSKSIISGDEGNDSHVLETRIILKTKSRYTRDTEMFLCLFTFEIF